MAWYMGLPADRGGAAYTIFNKAADALGNNWRARSLLLLRLNSEPDDDKRDKLKQQIITLNKAELANLRAYKAGKKKIMAQAEVTP